MLAQTPDPPYYAVIFTSKRTNVEKHYAETAKQMVDLAHEMPGFLGVESARNELGITVSYWKDEESIKHWKQYAEHLEAQKNGRTTWYEAYYVRVAKVERAYHFSKI